MQVWSLPASAPCCQRAGQWRLAKTEIPSLFRLLKVQMRFRRRIVKLNGFSPFEKLQPLFALLINENHSVSWATVSQYLGSETADCVNSRSGREETMELVASAGTC